MKYKDFSEFKQHAKAVHRAINSKLETSGETFRHKLTVIQEVLAQAQGFDTRAALKAHLDSPHSAIVKSVPEGLRPFLICVEGLAWDANDEPEFFAIVRPDYATCDDLLSGKGSHHAEMRSAGYLVGRCPELSPAFWSQGYVAGVHIECPSIGEYGAPYYGDVLFVAKRIVDNFQFKAVEFPEVYIRDRGDDGADVIFFEVWAPQTVLDTITALPLSIQ